MKPLSKIQRDHFKAMSASELKAAIADSERQMSVIAASTTAAGEHRRAELQQRIDYCSLLLHTKKTKPARKTAIIATPRKTDKGWLVVFACGHWKLMKSKPRNPNAGLCTSCD